eukprot:scaffold1624_cov233-Ochromonas_danica.AAC.2
MLLTKQKRGGHVEVVDILLNDNRTVVNQVDEYKRTPLFAACQYGHVEVVRKLLKHKQVKGDINKADKSRRSPFYMACRGGHEEVVDILLNDNRTVVNQVDEYKRTPLFAACQYGHVEVVRKLLEHERFNNEDIIKADKFGMTPLDVSQSEAIKSLLRKKRAKENGNEESTSFGSAESTFVGKILGLGGFGSSKSRRSLL